MIRFSKADPDLGQVRTCMQQIINNANIPELQDGLYIFGASAARPNAVYLSPLMLNVIHIANYFLSHGIDTVVEGVGNPPEQNWIALNYNFRKTQPNLAAKICLFTYLGLNNLILW